MKEFYVLKGNEIVGKFQAINNQDAALQFSAKHGVFLGWRYDGDDDATDYRIMELASIEAYCAIGRKGGSDDD